VGCGADHFLIHLQGKNNGIRVLDGDFLAPLFPVFIEYFPPVGIHPQGVYLGNPHRARPEMLGKSFDP
jgi:hypothetical protein